MLTRNLILPVVITGAIGLPLMMSNSETGSGDTARQSSYSSTQYSSTSLDPYGNGTVVYPGNQSGPDLSAGPLEFMPIHDLSTVFTFERTVDQIRSEFRRLSLVNGENGWQGLRTDLVTGTGTSDLHGCITWYFDSKGQMQKIAFRGWTGDYRHLRDILSERFLLVSGGQSGVRETMKLGNWGGVTSAAVFQLPQVIRQDAPQRQFAVELELNRSSSYSVSPAMKSMLQ